LVKRRFETFKAILIWWSALPKVRNHEVIDMKMNTIDWIALVLVVVGGLNWGLVGLFGFDLVAAIFGSMSFLSRVVYTLVGVSAVYTIVGHASKH
jgi:uncharacterized membrane protein YuzA (DUF378 family)